MVRTRESLTHSARRSPINREPLPTEYTRAIIPRYYIINARGGVSFIRRPVAARSRDILRVTFLKSIIERNNRYYIVFNVLLLLLVAVI